MDLYKATFLVATVICTVGGNVDDYAKTDGAGILSLHKREYSVNTVAECAVKCNDETAFTCKSFMYIEKDQECWTAEANSKVEPVIRKSSTALYEKKGFLLECVNGIGTDYRGTKSRTESGKTCQRWAEKFPHPHPNITPQTHPREDLDSNFCRNPDSDSKGPWCYTTDPSTRWEPCNVENCSHKMEECMNCSGEDYRGKISTTENGFTCQRWDTQKPHNHGYIPSVLPEKYLEENYCRNPDGDPRPWCFTTSEAKRWDLCSIPRCTASEPPTIVPELTCATGEGGNYRGTVNRTISGKTCQSWSVQTPHKHKRSPDNYPCKGLDNNNCRNPNSERMPWCYTTDSETRWEYCQVPSCEGAPGPDEPVVPAVEDDDCFVGDGSSFRGATTVTISGKKCQAWSSMTPHKHKKTPQAFPLSDLRRNLCRNPDGDRAPWCYTTDPAVRWEYCDPGRCSAKPSGVLPTKPAVPALPAATQTTPETERDCKWGNGATYNGSTSMTLLGVTCQAWPAQTPHRHNSFTPETHPTKGLESNSCRNPDNDVNGPWCYTTDVNKKWDYCQIPNCAGMKRECGVSPVSPRRCLGRIVGGCVSKPHSWPWQISLRTKNSGIHFCGGTLIAPQWVVTAAHCLEKSKSPSFYKVVMGIHTERANEASKQERTLDQLFLGPNGADIALLKLSSPALLKDKVLPVCLPDKDYVVPSGTGCYVTGWGETQGTGGERGLKEDSFPVIENKICNRPSYLNNRVRPHEMCAGNIEERTDSCQGDSGGPLVCNAQSNAQRKFVIQGVTSWGLGCANRMIYTRVSTFVDWIQSTMATN